MRSRHKARSIAMQTLYSLDMNGRLRSVALPYSEGFAGFSNEEAKELQSEVVLYATFLVNGVLEHLEQIDGTIRAYIRRRSFDSVSVVDRNILRISVFTLFFCKDVDSDVIIDEAVKLSLEFSTEINYRFINGVLDAIVRDCKAGVLKTEQAEFDEDALRSALRNFDDAGASSGMKFDGDTVRRAIRNFDAEKACGETDAEESGK